MRKWLIPLAGLAVLVLLLAAILPPLLERNAVRRCVLDMQEAIKAEDMPALEALILPAQRSLALPLIEPVLPGHGASVRSLRIRSMKRQGEGSYLVETVVSLDDPSWGRQIYEARLLLMRDAGHWQWSFSESEGRQFSLTDEGGWTKVADWLNLAQP